MLVAQQWHRLGRLGLGVFSARSSRSRHGISLGRINRNLQATLERHVHDQP
jgi:hypothetical protein